ncbi:hypothetical protein PTKIN_Ptkin01aG0294200 [Pterospermum kingtungense]
MEKKACICTVVAILGVISVATGFGAEFTRIKASEAKDTECSYSTSPALPLGLTAAVTLLIAQIIINFATGCMCCCRRTTQTWNSNGAKAVIFFILSRLAFVIAFYLLVSGAALNSQAFSNRGLFGSSLNNQDNGFFYQCYVVRPGAFAGASVLAAASVIFGILHYISLNTKKNTADPYGNGINGNGNYGPNYPNQGGLMTAQPQFPPQPPAYAHV